MLRDQAAAILGIPPSATPQEARKAYLARARLLHPDRFAGGSAQDLAAANTAMAQLNEAYEVMKTAPTHAYAGASTGTSSRAHDPDPEPETPSWTDPSTACDICGWGPAAPVKYNSVTGLLLFWRWKTLTATLCTFCGEAMYHEAQHSSFTKGWWGLIAPLANIIAVLGNRGAVASIRKLPLPQGRYAGTYAPSPVPLLFANTWWKRPAPLIATAAAALIALLVVGSMASSPTSAATPRPSSTTPGLSEAVASTAPTAPEVPSGSGLVGTCWADVVGTTQVQQVPCNDSTADWTIVSEHSSAAACPNDYIRADGLFQCLRKL
jgi:hypothetical protein